ncbi:MAG TPA: hypothetical protein PLX89_03735, partial [Verrucomicrobiota bacterium]|nr:hypothetical protein [Verrucomicrobiota bacterium]
MNLPPGNGSFGRVEVTLGAPSFPWFLFGNFTPAADLDGDEVKLVLTSNPIVAAFHRGPNQFRLACEPPAGKRKLWVSGGPLWVRRVSLGSYLVTSHPLR